MILSMRPPPSPLPHTHTYIIYSRYSIFVSTIYFVHFMETGRRHLFADLPFFSLLLRDIF